ncbi:MAG: ABC transporter substrate-binding protein [Actinomycetota bacterium]
MRRPKLFAGMIGLAVMAAGCGKSTTSTTPSPTTVAKPKVSVITVSFSESQIVAQMFAQVLTKAGYTVPAVTVVGARPALQAALPSVASLAPEYVGSLLAFLKGTESSDPVSETAQDNAILKPKGLTVLDPSAANDTNAFVVTQATATKYHLAKVSDLKAVASQLTLGAPPECATNPLCLPGLQSTYGIVGLKFQPIGACDTPTANALDAGAVQVAELCSTQSVIAQKGWVVLQDDKNLQPADNIAAEVSTALITANPEIKTLLDSVTAKITTANIVQLDAQVDIDHKDPSAVARTFLQSNGLL